MDISPRALRKVMWKNFIQSVVRQFRSPSVLRAKATKPLVLCLLLLLCRPVLLLADPAEARAELARLGIPFSDETFAKYAASGDSPVVQLFLEAGATPDARGTNGIPAIVLASKGGHDSIAALLLKAGANPKPLVHEVRSTSPNLTDLLMKGISQFSGVLIALVGAIFTYLYNQRSKRIHELETIEKLIPHFSADENQKATALVAVAHLATPDLAARLAELHPGRGSTIACLELLRAGKSDKRVIERALHRVIIVVARDGDRESFQILASQLGEERLRILLETKDEDGRTPLMWAARNNHAGLLDELIGSGAVISTSDKDGETALHLAVKHGRRETARKLLEVVEGWERKAQVEFVNRTDKDGRTALTRAQEKNYADLVNLLSAYRAPA
jgi:ankyrin repeat protein